MVNGLLSRSKYICIYLYKSFITIKCVGKYSVLENIARKPYLHIKMILHKTINIRSVIQYLKCSGSKWIKSKNINFKYLLVLKCPSVLLCRAIVNNAPGLFVYQYFSMALEKKCMKKL